MPAHTFAVTTTEPDLTYIIRDARATWPETQLEARRTPTGWDITLVKDDPWTQAQITAVQAALNAHDSTVHLSPQRRRVARLKELRGKVKAGTLTTAELRRAAELLIFQLLGKAEIGEEDNADDLGT